MNLPVSSKAKRSRLGKAIRWCIYGSIAAVILAAGAYLWAVLQLRLHAAAFEKHLANIRVAGDPVTLEEIVAWYPMIPDDLNPGRQVLAALDLYHFEDVPTMGVPHLDSAVELVGPWGDELASTASNYLGQLDLLTGELHRVLAMDAPSSFPINGDKFITLELEHLKPLKEASRLLACQAGLRIYQHDATGAADALVDILRLARTLRNEPFLVSHLVRKGMHEQTCETMGQAFARTAMPDEDLLRMRDALMAERTNDFVERGLIGERAGTLGTTMADAMEEGDETVSEADKARLTYWQNPGSAMTADYLNKMITIARKPVPDPSALKKLQDAFDAKMESTPSVLMLSYINAALLLPALLRTPEAHWNDLAQLDSALTGIAIERFHLANGRFPNELNELVPNYLDAVPQDPYANAPLQYRHNETGYRIWSIGSNR